MELEEAEEKKDIVVESQPSMLSQVSKAVNTINNGPKAIAINSSTGGSFKKETVRPRVGRNNHGSAEIVVNNSSPS